MGLIFPLNGKIALWRLSNSGTRRWSADGTRLLTSTSVCRDGLGFANTFVLQLRDRFPPRTEDGSRRVVVGRDDAPPYASIRIRMDELELSDMFMLELRYNLSDCDSFDADVATEKTDVGRD
jgi:hypothetical protein